ncbi:ABC transporter substrate-binding protein [Corynebacterium sp. SCR221107]|nr:ABC transporter substrate-binding protein [Corynebacterium sp. SCR221107]WBT08386.1 ABC transporter substrate-binding protein [Corynebacterium sp. SCR221107]
MDNKKSLRIAAPIVALMTGLTMTACANTDSSTESTQSSGGGQTAGLTIGTTDKVTKLDPAGSYDNGSFNVMRQVYGFLVEPEPGSTDAAMQPSLAESAEFSSPTEYTVKLKSGLKFANGNELTSSDVKFSFDRQIAIDDPNGPASLLGNLDSVSTPDDTTVVFKLKAENDQTFPLVLNSPAGPIVDEDTFSADATMDNADVVATDGFAGPYAISSFSENELVSYAANPDYQGLLGAPKTENVNVKYYADASNLKLDIQQNNIDVAYRSLSATDIEDLRGNDNVQVIEGPGGEIRYLVFNFDTMPFGAKTPEADPAKATAVRQAIAASIDRSALATDIYKDTYAPLYSSVASAMDGATTPVKDKYLTADGAPDVEKAKEILSAAGVTDPVELNIQYNPDHYGPSSGDEYAAIKSQLEATGLFTVNLQSTEWVQYNKDRVSDVYPIYQLGWFPDFSDADNYLTPFFTKDNFLENHYENAKVEALIKQEVTTADPAERLKLIGDIQELEADHLSTVPLLEGKQFAIAGKDVSGVILDSSFHLRFGSIEK